MKKFKMYCEYYFGGFLWYTLGRLPFRYWPDCLTGYIGFYCYVLPEELKGDSDSRGAGE